MQTLVEQGYTLEQIQQMGLSEEPATPAAEAAKDEASQSEKSEEEAEDERNPTKRFL